MKNINIYIFAIALLFIGGCEGDKEPIPSYIHVMPIQLETNNNQGTDDASAFPDVWVTLKQEGFLGNYELPATIPLLASGNTDVFLDAGIKLNGIKNTPDIYGVLNRLELVVDLQPNEVDTIYPIFTYSPDVVFPYIEDFEGSNSLNVILDTNIVTNTSLTTDGAFDGGKSVTFMVDEDNPIFEVATLTKMELPTGTQDQIFLEMHYKNEGLLEVGLVGYETGGTTANVAYFIALNPKSEWNKIYINLTNELINVNPNLTEFQIVFGTRLPEGVTSSRFHIDNIKVLYREDN